MSRLITAATLALVASTPAWSQGKIDAKLMQIYGGVLAPNCSNYLLPQLKYLGDSLVVQDQEAAETGSAPALSSDSPVGGQGCQWICSQHRVRC